MRGFLGQSALLALVGTVVVLMLAVPTPILAAGTFTASAVSATVTGNSVTATTTVKSSQTRIATLAGVCARSAGDGNRGAGRVLHRAAAGL